MTSFFVGWIKSFRFEAADYILAGQKVIGATKSWSRDLFSYGETAAAVVLKKCLVSAWAGWETSNSEPVSSLNQASSPRRMRVSAGASMPIRTVLPLIYLANSNCDSVSDVDRLILFSA